MLLIKKIWYRL